MLSPQPAEWPKPNTRERLRARGLPSVYARLPGAQPNVNIMLAGGTRLDMLSMSEVLPVVMLVMAVLAPGYCRVAPGR